MKLAMANSIRLILMADVDIDKSIRFRSLTDPAGAINIFQQSIIDVSEKDVNMFSTST